MEDQRALHRFHFKRYYMQNKLSANVRGFFYLRCKLRFDAKEVASFFSDLRISLNETFRKIFQNFGF